MLTFSYGKCEVHRGISLDMSEKLPDGVLWSVMRQVLAVDITYTREETHEGEGEGRKVASYTLDMGNRLSTARRIRID